MARLTIDTLNYYIKIYSPTNQQEYLINDFNLSSNGIPYYIDGYTLNNDIFDPLANTCDIDLIFSPNDTYYSNNSTSIVTDAILSGNVIELFETYYDQVEGTPLFIGYIKTLKPNKSYPGGLKITLRCSSILSQLGKQLVVNSSNEVLTLLGDPKHPITNYFENQIPLGQILSFMTNQSLLGFVLKTNLVETSSNFQGTPLPFLVTDYGANGIDIYTPVFYYANTEDDRLTSLMRTLYAYQFIMYQDLNGTVNITQPNAGTSFSAWYFEIGAYNKSISDSAILITDYDVELSSADVTNRAFSSLFNVGFNITEENSKQQYNYVANVTGDLFPRVKELYDTGIFTISKHDQVDIGPGMITDPLLLNVLISSLGNNQIVLTNLSGDKSINTITGIYANTLLAKELFNETQITLTMARGSCVDPASTLLEKATLLPIPFGQMVNVNDFNQLGLSTNSFYVYGFTLNSHSDRGTLLTLKLCKPYTQVALWGNVPIS